MAGIDGPHASRRRASGPHGPARRSARATRSPSSASCTSSCGLATTAQTWEELLETVVDGTRDALGASVSSLYLLDRDGTRLTLAATNGLDRFQIGRAVVPFGEGITGRVAATREPMVIPDVARRPPVPVGPRASTSAGSSPRCCPCR